MKRTLLRRRILNLGLLIILVSLIMFPTIIHKISAKPSLSPTREYYPASWLSGWEYRKSHEVVGSSGAGTNYQIRIHVEYGSGSDSGNTVYLDSNCKSDFGDLRFTSDDGVTELDYWIEEFSSGDDATFWVEVFDSLDSSKTFYIYYGNEGASSTSNGDNTFLFFDGFQNTLDTTKWDTFHGSISTSNGYLELQGTSGTRGEIDSKISHAFSYNTACQISGYASESALENTHIHTIRHYQDQYNKFTNYGAENPNRVKTVARAGTSVSSDTNTVNDVTNRHRYVIYRDQNWMSWYQDGDEVVRLTSGISTTDFGVSFTEGTDPSDVFYVDYVFVRNWIETEPSHGYWGTEESVGATATTDTTSTTPTITTEDANIELPLSISIAIPVIAIVVVAAAAVLYQRSVVKTKAGTADIPPSPPQSKRVRQPPSDPRAREELILGALKSYPRIGIDELSEITGIDEMETRDTILRLIANDRVSGTFDRSTDEFVSADATRTGREIKSQTEGPRGLPRCPYCGAPLEKTLGIGETGTCPSCGRKLMG